jgi:ParB/RepB/Spo0J family partition protein
MTTSALTTPKVDIDKIIVLDDYNAREDFDPKEQAEMAADVAEVGIVEPLPVFLREDGTCELLAGERRYRAAIDAGLKTVPVAPQASRDRRVAFSENHHRKNLNPIETARDLKALKEERGVSTIKELAKVAKKDPGWISLHLRLLQLPEGVQRAIVAGTVPPDAERLLRPVARVSPAVAEWICEYARTVEVTPTRFRESFRQIVDAAAQSADKCKPTMISTRTFSLSESVADPALRDELIDRWVATLPSGYLPSEDTRLYLSDLEFDAARAAGCLLEVSDGRNGFASISRFITDPAMAADLAKRLIEGLEGEAKERAERKEKAEKEKKKARSFNERLLTKIARGCLSSRRKKATLQRAKAAALILIDQNPELAGAGLRLVWPSLSQVDTRTLKSGAKRTAVTYADKAQSTETLVKKVMQARSVEEVHELLAEAMELAMLANGNAVANSRRITWLIPCGVRDEVRKLLAGDLKALRGRISAA